jgi:hypothetical protein
VGLRVGLLVVGWLATGAHAGTLVGKIELPSLTRPEATHGFLDRVENPLAPLKPFSAAPQLVVELVGDEKPAAPPQVVWHLLGESFDRPVLAAPAGSEIVIRDDSKTARTLIATELGKTADTKLIPPGPVNPQGSKPFRAGDAGKVYSIGDPDAPHLKATLIVVNTLYVGYPDESGKFEILDVRPGAYKLRIWYQGKLIERPDDNVNVAAKGKTDFNPKLPAGAIAPAKK